METRDTTKEGAAVRAPKARWNMLAYLAGDNNLEGAAGDDLNEMEAVGSSESLHLVAQIDRAAGFDATNGDWKTTRRYLVKRGANASTIESTLLADLGETNSGDADTVGDFLTWGADQYPAERTLVVLWNHGSGFYVPPEYLGEDRGFTRSERARARRALKRSFFHGTREKVLSQTAARRGILYDDASMDCLDNQELVAVLDRLTKKLGRRVDVLGMDACLMTMIEVAWQVRKHAEILVGSEEVEPADGWPYDAVLRDLAANPAMGAADLARAVVKRYLASYPASERVTQAAIRLDRLDDLVRAMDRLAGHLTPATASSFSARQYEVYRARRDCTNFYDNLYVDIGEFATRLQAVTASSRVRSACTSIRTILADHDAGPVLVEGHKGAGLGACTGLSVYLPLVRAPSDFYADLQFAKDTRWNAFLTKHFGA